MKALADATQDWLDSLDPAQRSEARASFDSRDREQWTYLPGTRPGLALRDMSDVQRQRAFGVLEAALSDRGAATAKSIIALDDILGEIESAEGRAVAQRRNSLHYWFRVHGTPGADEPWSIKVGGHHVAVHVTVVRGAVASTPLFFGANPATVPHTHPKSGMRTLADEEDVARLLLAALTPNQRDVAIGPVATDDIRTRTDPVADPSLIPSGLSFGQMDGEGRELLGRLIRLYVGRALPQVADAAWHEIEDVGLDEVNFRWEGATEKAPGNGHYYSVLGPTFLLEYDNTQTNSNHIHTVWRDLRHDWGRDLLAAHYDEADHDIPR